MGCAYSEIKIVALNLEQAIIPYVGIGLGQDTDQFTLLSALDKLDSVDKGEFRSRLAKLNRALSSLISSGIRVLIVSDWKMSLASTAAYVLELNFNFLVGCETRPKTIHDKLQRLFVPGTQLGDVGVDTFGLNERSELVYFSTMFAKDLPYGTNESVWVCHICREEYSNLEFENGNEFCSECKGIRLSCIYEPIRECALNSISWSGLVEHVAEVVKRNSESLTDASCLHSQNHFERLGKQRHVLLNMCTSDSFNRVDSGTGWAQTCEYEQWNSPDQIRVFNSFRAGKYVEEPFINPDFITLFEYENNVAIRNELFEMLRNVFPPEEISNRYKVHVTDPSYFSFFPFSDLMGQNLLVPIKNWRKGFRSGPDIRLLHLEFIALVMAASLVMVEGRYSIVSAPASDFSKEKPGQVSLHLASRIAQLLGAELVDILVKDTEVGVKSYQTAQGECDILLIDDQITYGETIQKSLEALDSCGFNVIQIATWSYSSSKPIQIASDF